MAAMMKRSRLQGVGTGGAFAFRYWVLQDTMLLVPRGFYFRLRLVVLGFVSRNAQLMEVRY